MSKRIVKRAGRVLGSAGIAVMLMILWATVSFADDNTQFVSGTTVNSISIGGMTVDGAKAAIENYYTNEYKLAIIRKGGTKDYIIGSEIGYKASVSDGLSAILDAQNAGGRKSGPSMDNSNTLPVNASYDDAALTAKISALACVSGSSVSMTANARISDYQEGQLFSIIPETYGNSVDLEKTAALIRQTAAAGQSEVNLEAGGCYQTVTVTSEDEQLKNLCNTMNQIKDMVITYTFGEASEVLTGAVMSQWVTGVTDGLITINQEQAGAYIKSLADKYDTVNKPRNFHTTSGKDVSLTGSFGWQIDQAAETAALTAMIRTGQSQAREPQYAVSAVSRTDGDWGKTYVEIDMTSQHVYMYQDGSLVWDAPCVTGNVSKNYTTPEGIYTLTYKEMDRILRGKKMPDGSYEYESHVDYWMPFNGGIGLHDATWRSKFGGTIYQSGGSHGCINLPPDKAKILYGLIYKGIPVICFN